MPKRVKKWGKIGAPKSDKRRKWLRRCREAQKGVVLSRRVNTNRKKRKRG